MNYTEFVSFVLASIVLLGSPGPAIAAILAVGRANGWAKSIPFFVGLQFGLASAAFLTSVGLFAVLSAFPNLLYVMAIVATAYLLYLAFKIATSPVGEKENSKSYAPSALSGFAIGVTNPKAYLAFASLFGAFQIFATNQTTDSFIKWIGVVVVMISVDLIWLWIGVRLGRLKLSETSERTMNYLMAAAIVVAAIYAAV